MTKVATRRTVLMAMAGASTLLSRPALAQASPRVVVVGGGFGGATAALALKQAGNAVTLVEPNETYTACPMSNLVLAGLRDIAAQRFGYEGLARSGVARVRQSAARIDPQSRRVTLADGTHVPYDRLVLSPGIDLRFDALPGYGEEATQIFPHAWNAGEQTTLLRRQLEAMEDGGTVVLSAPANPYRCPPGPYERASLLAHYLKTHKPRSKLLILDAKDSFSKQRLFQAAWRDLYPGLLEWIPLSQGGRVVEVDTGERTFITEFGRHRADVGNVIPPQRAARITQDSGIADGTGWCPIDPVTFESRLHPYIHVIGDAAIAGGMPKSAFAANAQAKACADAVSLLLRGETPSAPKLINTCYSLVAPDYGISVAGVYRPANGLLADVEGAGGTSPLDAPASSRSLEAAYADAWFKTITAEAFG